MGIFWVNSSQYIPKLKTQLCSFLNFNAVSYLLCNMHQSLNFSSFFCFDILIRYSSAFSLLKVSTGQFCWCIFFNVLKTSYL